MLNEQQPQREGEQPFTVDTAKVKSDQVIEGTKMAYLQSGGLGGAPTKSAGLGQMPTPQTQQQTSQEEMDTSALAAVQNGQVSAEEVMNDPRISDGAKASLGGVTLV